jgi:hypothetical protein
LIETPGSLETGGVTLETFPFGLSTLGRVGTPALESDGAVIPTAPLEGVLTAPGAVTPGAAISLTLPKLGMKPRSSSGLTIEVTLKLEMAGGSTETGASRLNPEVNPGVDSGFVLWALEPGVIGVSVFGLMLKAVTPKAGVLTLGVAEFAVRFAPLENAGVLVALIGWSFVLAAGGSVVVAG